MLRQVVVPHKTSPARIVLLLVLITVTLTILSWYTLFHSIQTNTNNPACPSHLLARASSACSRPRRDPSIQLVGTSDHLITATGTDFGRRRQLYEYTTTDFERAIADGWRNDLKIEADALSTCERMTNELFLPCLPPHADDDVPPPTIIAFLLTIFSTTIQTSSRLSTWLTRDDTTSQSILAVQQGIVPQTMIHPTSTFASKTLYHNPPPRQGALPYPAGSCWSATDETWTRYFGLNSTLDGSLNFEFVRIGLNTDHTATTTTTTWRCIPSLLLIGVQKGSSTELRRWLLKHPHISFSRPYATEAHVLDRVSHLHDALAKYLAFTTTDSGALYRGVMIAEKTPAYFHQPEVALKIARYLPGASMVLILRDPAKRLHSGYWNYCFFIRYIKCSNAVLSTAITNLLQGRDMRDGGMIMYQVQIGKYFDLLTNMFTQFRKRLDSNARMFLAFDDDFHAAPLEMMDGLQDWLDLPHFDYRTVAGYVHGRGWQLHDAQHVRFGKVHHENYEPMSPQLYELCAKVYASDNAKLATLLRDAAAWPTNLPVHIHGSSPTKTTLPSWLVM